MKLITETFTKQRYNYIQKFREEDIAIYQMYDPEHQSILCFETIIIQKAESHPFKEVNEPYEYYPGTSTWGTYGWTYGTYQNALEKAKQILSTKKLSV